MIRLDHVARLQAKAEQVRVLAGTMHDLDCRRTMLTLAAEYQMVADHMASLDETLSAVGTVGRIPLSPG